MSGTVAGELSVSASKGDQRLMVMAPPSAKFWPPSPLRGGGEPVAVPEYDTLVALIPSLVGEGGRRPGEGRARI